MATLNVWSAWELTSNGRQRKGGNRSAPVEVTVDGKVKDISTTLATATTVTPWDGTDTNEALTDFDFLWLKSNQNILLELTCDKGAEVGTVVFAKEIQANQDFMLLSDDAMALYTANFATGTEDKIDRLRLRNVSGSTATIEGALVT